MIFVSWRTFGYVRRHFWLSQCGDGWGGATVTCWIGNKDTPKHLTKYRAAPRQPLPQKNYAVELCQIYPAHMSIGPRLRSPVLVFLFPPESICPLWMPKWFQVIITFFLSLRSSSHSHGFAWCPRKPSTQPFKEYTNTHSTSAWSERTGVGRRPGTELPQVDFLLWLRSGLRCGLPPLLPGQAALHHGAPLPARDCVTLGKQVQVQHWLWISR